MDGWESRRRRLAGHDWCVIKLAYPGRILGVEVDTAWFTGNHAVVSLLLQISLLAAEVAAGDDSWMPGATERAAAGGGQRGSCKTPAEIEAADASVARAATWHSLLPVTPLRPGYPGSSVHHFTAGADLALERATHLRLNYFPDGGVARLRVYGRVKPALATGPGAPSADLAALENGGRGLGESNAHYGRASNMLQPGRGIDMGDGWETARHPDRPAVLVVDPATGLSNATASDWAVVRLGAACARVEQLVVDTNHFKGNCPESVEVHACSAPAAQVSEVCCEPSASPVTWRVLLPRTRVDASREHLFFPTGASDDELAAAANRSDDPQAVCERGLSDIGPVTHLRLTIFPDGGAECDALGLNRLVQFEGPGRPSPLVLVLLPAASASCACIHLATQTGPDPPCLPPVLVRLLSPPRRSQANSRAWARQSGGSVGIRAGILRAELRLGSHRDAAAVEGPSQHLPQRPSAESMAIKEAFRAAVSDAKLAQAQAAAAARDVENLRAALRKAEAAASKGMAGGDVRSQPRSVPSTGHASLATLETHGTSSELAALSAQRAKLKQQELALMAELQDVERQNRRLAAELERRELRAEAAEAAAGANPAGAAASGSLPGLALPSPGAATAPSAMPASARAPREPRLLRAPGLFWPELGLPVGDTYGVRARTEESSEEGAGALVSGPPGGNRDWPATRSGPPGVRVEMPGPARVVKAATAPEVVAGPGIRLILQQQVNQMTGGPAIQAGLAPETVMRRAAAAAAKGASRKHDQTVNVVAKLRQQLQNAGEKERLATTTLAEAESAKETAMKESHAVSEGAGGIAGGGTGGGSAGQQQPEDTLDCIPLDEGCLSTIDEKVELEENVRTEVEKVHNELVKVDQLLAPQKRLDKARRVATDGAAGARPPSEPKRSESARLGAAGGHMSGTGVGGGSGKVDRAA
ncbi:unnamed protein product [Prorocentrum cordatum]|uniref:Allantoicase domain-containing protein n=1 Tax=Prorocentrum cordatum TaxID=2364126 RepID=A0ABN9RSW5_9DINO|nr:unnamed protein product [Polarella glacialis]